MKNLINRACPGNDGQLVIEDSSSPQYTQIRRSFTIKRGMPCKKCSNNFLIILNLNV